MLRAASVVASLAIVSLSSFANAAVYNYFDTTFNNGDWNGVKYVDTSVPLGSFTAAQANPNGSALLPGPQTPDYRQIVHTYGGGGGINVTHQASTWNWTPLPLETATTLDYSYDLRFFSQLNDGAVGFSPAIFQGGNVYRIAYDNVFNNITPGTPEPGWQRFSGTGIPVSSFQQIDSATGNLLAGTPNPNAAMGFGFVSANSANQTNYVKTSGIDDFRIDLNTIRVPEPASLAAITLAMPLLRRRR